MLIQHQGQTTEGTKSKIVVVLGQNFANWNNDRYNYLIRAIGKILPLNTSSKVRKMLQIGLSECTNAISFGSESIKWDTRKDILRTFTQFSRFILSRALGG